MKNTISPISHINERGDVMKDYSKMLKSELLSEVCRLENLIDLDERQRSLYDLIEKFKDAPTSDYDWDGNSSWINYKYGGGSAVSIYAMIRSVIDWKFGEECLWYDFENILEALHLAKNHYTKNHTIDIAERLKEVDKILLEKGLIQ